MNQPSRSHAIGRSPSPPSPLKPLSLEKFVQRSLLSRIVIAMGSAAVTSAVLIFVGFLSRPMSAPIDPQIAAPTTGSQPVKTRRMSLADDAMRVAPTA